MKQMILVFGLIAMCCGKANGQAFTQQPVASDMPLESAIINMFPNPATNFTTVVLRYDAVQEITIDVVDYNGQIRRSFRFAPGGRQLSFDISFLERGNYVIRLRETARLLDIAKLVKG